MRKKQVGAQMYFFLSAPISSNEFDYVTFRRKAECVRSAMRCALSKSSKTARIRTSEAKSARTEHRRRSAPRGEAHNPKLCGAAEVSGKEGNLKTVEIRIDTASPGESHGEVTSDKNQ